MQKKHSQISEIWRRLKKNRPAVIGMYIFLAFCLVAIFGTILIPYSKSIDIDMANRFVKPCAEHWFGTDMYGRDLFARVVHSARYSMTIGVIASFSATILGVLIGALASFYGKGMDVVLMRLMDILASVPALLMALVIVATMGANLRNLIIAITVSNIPGFARVSRSTMLTIRETDYVEAARAYGTSDWRIIWKYILPNAVGPIIVTSTMSISDTILAAASLSYMGLGIQPPTPEWGGLLNAGREFMSKAPYLLYFPGLAIVLASLSISLFGDGLRDALDPKLKD